MEDIKGTNTHPPSINMPSVNDVSSISQAPRFGAQPSGNFTDFHRDQNLIDFLDNEEDVLEVDMGQIDEEERPFMIVDKDTGKVYDLRNENHLDRLTVKNSTRNSVVMKPEELKQEEDKLV
jgi:hypothetical protein